ncbi:30S ribosomal protein S1, partial [Lutispora sp.]|uniref:30S ribosomal protein S1 n=1 Tax=Lutispora sp. TaxID=2828727 RepID=UPI002B1E9909
VLSKKLVDADKNWYKLEYAYNENSSVPGIVKEIVKGGGIVEIFGIRTFMPASLFDLRYVNDLESYKNSKVDVKIIEFDKDNRKVLVSRKGHLLEQKEAKEKEFWAHAEVDQKIIGEVKRVTDFGAFVDIGGVDGLIHISELSWSRIEHPSEVVKPGDKVEVVILSLDSNKNKISLGLKQTKPEPWTTVEGKYNTGDIVNVRILRFAAFGAFAEVEPGIDGLIHISQISDKRIGKPSDVLTINQVVKAKIVDINIPERKLSLSLKEIEE